MGRTLSGCAILVFLHRSGPLIMVMVEQNSATRNQKKKKKQSKAKCWTWTDVKPLCFCPTCCKHIVSAMHMQCTVRTSSVGNVRGSRQSPRPSLTQLLPIYSCFTYIVIKGYDDRFARVSFTGHKTNHEFFLWWSFTPNEKISIFT